jgi:hypothetical protein
MQSAKSGVSRVLGLLSIKTACLRQAVRHCHVLTVTHTRPTRPSHKAQRYHRPNHARSFPWRHCLHLRAFHRRGSREPQLVLRGHASHGMFRLTTPEAVRKRFATLRGFKPPIWKPFCGFSQRRIFLVSPATLSTSLRSSGRSM